MHELQLLPLAESRELSARERQLLDWLLSSPAAISELREQAQSARVTSARACGCPSVGLGVPRDAPRARWPSGHPDVRHGQDLSIVASAAIADGRPVDVVLHVLDGRLHELEVWGQGTPDVSLPEPGSFRF